IFLGREINRTQQYSEKTAEKIDAAVSDIIHEQFERARVILEERQQELIVLAAALLQYETVEGKHVDEILEFGEIRSEVISSKTELDEKAEKSVTRGEAEKKKKKKEESHPPAV